MQSCLWSFKRDLKGYRNIARLDRYKLCNGDNWRNHPSSKRRLKRGYLQWVQTPKGVTMRQDYWGLPLHPYWDIDTLEHFYKVPVHKCTRFGEQTGGARDLCAVTGLWCHCSYRCGGIAPVTGMSSWRATQCLGGTAQAGTGVELPSVRQHLECIKLCLGVDSKQVQCLWVRVKGQITRNDR